MKYLLILLLAGCTMLPSQPRSDWPEDMKVTVQVVDAKTFMDKCGPAGNILLGMWVLACSEWDIKAKTCDTYYPDIGPIPDWLLRHEEMRCKGYI